jgi:tetratricopeptide (TPR) repeat protein
VTMPLNSAIVRIRAVDGRVVGAGFLVDQSHVLTCAHVVAKALGLPDHVPEMPQDEVRLDFPLISPGEILTAQVIFRQLQDDIAGLEVKGDPPAATEPLHLVATTDFWLHPFRAFGFPTGYDEGVWASGVLRGQQATGWVQIEDVKEPGYWVQPGFSGTPIWDEQLNGVVGMAVAADTQREIKAAFMIPASMLVEAWPELARRSLDATSLEYLQEQLAVFEAAQQSAPDPRRFQARIDELGTAIANWERRVEQQRQRIADGLDEQHQLVVEGAHRHEKRRLRVVGRRPLDVADYFKNRKREQETLGALLAKPATRLVSVIGHGGMGKTALACKVLRDLECHRWPYTEDQVPVDGIVYLSTRTMGISLERLFLDCSKLLDGEEEGQLNAIWTNPQLKTEDKISHLLEAFSGGRYVILLDNVEDLLDDGGRLLDADPQIFFDQSLAAAHGARLLVTSRLALALRREVMRFDQQVKLLEGLPIPDGIALLRELDPNGEYGLRNAPEEQLVQATSLVHGVPRALEVLAGILANDPFASLAEILEGFYEQVDVVQALIEENYKRLDGDARRVIEALAVFKHPVPPLAVDYLLEPFAPGLDVPGIIWRLTRTNIVSVDRANKMLTLHPIDQDYAYSQLPEEVTGESAYSRQALERRAADYYVQLCTPPERWKTIDDLAPQLAEFEHRIRARDYEDACRVLDSIDFDYLYVWGHYGRLTKSRERLLGRLADSSMQASNLGNLGRAYRALGQFEQAISFHQQSLAIARKIGQRRQEQFQLSNLGLSHRALGQIDHAIGFYQETLAIARKVGDRKEEAFQLGHLGLTYRDLGQFEQAIEFLGQALDTVREIGYRRGEGMYCGHLGRAYYALGQVGRAIKLYEEALAIAREIGYRSHQVIWLSSLGNAYRDLRQIEQAVKLYDEALNIAREIGYRLGESFQLLELGRVMMAGRNLSEAKQCCSKALALNMPETSYSAALVLSIVLLSQRDSATGESFADTVSRCRVMLDRTPSLYAPHYVLATALVGQAVCDPRWTEEDERAELLASALAEYDRALGICSAPGVVQDALRDLELIRAAGIEGLEPVFELLEGAVTRNV